MSTHGLTFTTVNISAPVPGDLERFYMKNLDGGVSLSFQTEPGYVHPGWPAQDGDQQMMMHLEIRVDDLEAAGAHAAACGATLATFQPQDDVRVYFDPVGHPLCLWLG